MKKGKTTRTYGTAADIVSALRSHHGPGGQVVPPWLFIANLRMGVGFASSTNPHADQSIDAWAMALWSSLKLEKVAYEVKVSRHDFFRELENPDKRQAALSVSNLFYFAVPASLVAVNEVPDEAGLVYVDGRGCHFVKRAPRREGPAPSWSFIASVARRLRNIADESADSEEP